MSDAPITAAPQVGRCPLCMGKGAYKLKRLEVNGTLYLNAKVPCGVCQGSGRWIHVDGRRVSQ